MAVYTSSLTFTDAEKAATLAMESTFENMLRDPSVIWALLRINDIRDRQLFCCWTKQKRVSRHPRRAQGEPFTTRLTGPASCKNTGATPQKKCQPIRTSQKKKFFQEKGCTWNAAC